MKNTSILGIALGVAVLGVLGVYAFMNNSTTVTTDPTMSEELSMDKTSMENKESTDTDTAMMEKNPTQMVKIDDTMMEKEDDKMAKLPVEMMEKSGKYTPFSAETMASAATTSRVLFFYANWCPTCKTADESFTKDVAKIPANVTLIRVNYNDTQTEQAEKNLAKKHGVTYQHTFVQIDAQDNEVAKWNGGQINELIANIN